MNFKVTFRETNRSFNVIFREINRSFNVIFQTQERRFDVEFGEIHPLTKYIGGELFTGDYEVTPRIQSQIVPTKDKVMSDDMTVKAIPFYNVSNTSGGHTVYIGSEV